MIAIHHKDGTIEFLNYSQDPKRYEKAETKMHATSEYKHLCRCGAAVVTGTGFAALAIAKALSGEANAEIYVVGVAGAAAGYGALKWAAKTINDYGEKLNMMKERMGTKTSSQMSWSEIIKTMYVNKNISLQK